ncbi:hypothetical protein RS030_162414 [Cryptosporidium xiaoi]|uniref:Transcription initiation factor TFIID subunit 12 domain-containing protein n=1 Tax=Cryptosporidium xiaoi TaxID=659607 RepID=A0AAV9Y019_9CRYT
MSDKKYIKVIPESITSIKNLLNDMNIDSYDNKILDQLLNVAFSISQELIINSNEYTRMNSRFRIEENDARMAISNYIRSNVVNQNSFLSNRVVSNEINSIPLPAFPNKGVSRIWLPPEDEMHITPGWRINVSNSTSGMNNSDKDNNLSGNLYNSNKNTSGGLSNDFDMNDSTLNINANYLDDLSDDGKGSNFSSNDNNRR